MAFGDDFKGLPMKDLIGGPLQAAADANTSMAIATADFIQKIGFRDVKGNKEVITADFALTVPGKPDIIDFKVPLLAIVNIPSLKVTEVDITFDMEIKTSESSKESKDKSGEFSASGGWGPFKASVSGSVSSHQENTRTSDKSAKYHVKVAAMDTGMPEGLSRVMDIMNSIIVPPKELVEAKGATSLPSPEENEAAIKELIVNYNDIYNEWNNDEGTRDQFKARQEPILKNIKKHLILDSNKSVVDINNHLGASFEDLEEIT